MSPCATSRAFSGRSRTATCAEAKLVRAEWEVSPALLALYTHFGKEQRFPN